MKSIHTEVKEFFRREKLPRPTRILAAVSGGPDSTALALVLAQLREELGFSLALAHYDHGLRSSEESRAEEAFVRSLGDSLSLPVETGRAAEGGLRDEAAKEKKSLEAAAREARYAFLRAAAARASCAFIALGHTRTDRIENQIFRFFQGSGLQALAGIRGRRGRIIRPLIGVDRSGVLAFLAERAQGYCTDASNGDAAFLRNHLRLALVPAVEEVFPGFGKALDALGEKFSLYADFVKKALRDTDPWVKTGLGWECSWEEFLGLHPVLRIQSVYKLCPARGEKRIPYAFLAPLAKLPRAKTGTILRGRGLEILRRGKRLLARRDIVLNQKKGYFYLIDGNLDFCIQEQLRVEAEEVPSRKEEEDVFFCGGEDCLLLRSRRPGDVIDTGRGEKKLGRLLSEWKVEERLRGLVPLVQKNGKIVAVLAAPWGGKTLRLPEEGGEAGRFFRIRIRKIGEKSGQQTE
jgi:tRNA(Ile)-lysidine synthase